jgi:hypothetical protein
VTALTISGKLRTAPADKELLAVPVSKLADEHPLTKAGLRCVYVVEKAELGLRPGDIVFEFPSGRIVDTSMACRCDGIIPPEIDIMAIHKEANATRAALPRRSQLIGSTLAAARGERFTIAKTGEGAILGPTTTPKPRNVGYTPSLLDAGSCPDDCSGSSNAGRRHTLPDGLEDRNAFGLPDGLGPPDEPTNRAMPR